MQGRWPKVIGIGMANDIRFIGGGYDMPADGIYGNGPRASVISAACDHKISEQIPFRGNLITSGHLGQRYTAIHSVRTEILLLTCYVPRKPWPPFPLLKRLSIIRNGYVFYKDAYKPVQVQGNVPWFAYCDAGCVDRPLEVLTQEELEDNYWDILGRRPQRHSL
eukprot:jgi/Chlat1/9274/Chrsp99S08492